MSITPTDGNAAPNRSGRCVNAAPINKPPLLPPPIASFRVDVYLLSINHCAAAMKSSNTFCFLDFIPAWCHSSPYSPPPRRFGCAETPPTSLHPRLPNEPPGVLEMLRPPYP